MKKKKQWVLYGAILVVPALVWLSWPLGSKQFEINFDEKALANKSTFLNTPLPSDTVPCPNIVVLLADDLGWSDISLNGSPFVQTTNIDRFARQGAICPKAYVTAPVCAPSRAGLITGRYQQRFGFETQMHYRHLRNRLEYLGYSMFVKSDPWTIEPRPKVPRKEDEQRQGLPPSEITLPELLKKRNYNTALIGKWHLGHAEHSLPHHRGFDYHYGFYASHSLYAPEGTPGIVDMRNPADWTDKHIWKDQRDGSSAIYRNGLEVEEPEYLTQRMVEESIQFIDQHQDEPFFLMTSFSAPHTPFQVPESDYNQLSEIEDPVKRTYNAMIANLDDAVGRIYAHLESEGLLENTLIFFLSDNGGAAYTFATDNHPLNGGKITQFDGGLRIPFFMQWQDVIEPGTVYPYPVSAMDVFVTVAEAAGISLPEDRHYDGKNLIPLFKAKNPLAAHEALYWKIGNNRVIIKDGWKLMFDELGKQVLLFHLDEDPQESKNVAADFPALVTQLMQVHHAWESELPPPLWPTVVSFKFEDEQGEYHFDL